MLLKAQTARESGLFHSSTFFFFFNLKLCIFDICDFNAVDF